jgi:hypothetical protein
MGNNKLIIEGIQVNEFSENSLRAIFSINNNVMCVNFRIDDIKNLFGELTFIFNPDSFSFLSFRENKLKWDQDLLTRVSDALVLKFFEKDNYFQDNLEKRLVDFKENVSFASEKYKDELMQYVICKYVKSIMI